MEIIKIKQQKFDEQIITQIINVMKNGGVIVYPTDTCYGIGADWQNTKAVTKISQIKQRPNNKIFSVIVSDIAMIKNYCDVSKYQEKILNKYLPGPYTFILSKAKNKVLIKSSETLGVRIPAYPFTQKLAKKFNRPFITTSANISGQNPCYNVNCILEQIKFSQYKPDLIINAGQLQKNPPSKVVDLTKSNWKIVRK